MVQIIKPLEDGSLLSVPEDLRESRMGSEDGDDQENYPDGDHWCFVST